MKFLESKTTLFTIATIAFVAGTFFIDKRITGNIIVSQQYFMNWISLTGFGLMGGAIILIVYALRKKD